MWALRNQPSHPAHTLFLTLLPWSAPWGPREKVNKPHVLNFVARESMRVVKEKSLCQMQHSAQG